MWVDPSSAHVDLVQAVFQVGLKVQRGQILEDGRQVAIAAGVGLQPSRRLRVRARSE
jgi:hypothetical protein